jgi:hypothetical protein
MCSQSVTFFKKKYQNDVGINIFFSLHLTQLSIKLNFKLFSGANKEFDIKCLFYQWVTSEGLQCVHHSSNGNR